MRPELSDYTHLSAGKVREIYEVDRDTLLMLATDRISAFDYSLTPEIPDKGRILTATSTLFFDLLERELGLPNHLAGPVTDERIPEEVLGRAHVVKRLEMIPFECVARGYLTGSGKKEYDATGRICGVMLPAGLVEASRLSEPIFTPATKAEQGEHDENVSFSYVASKLGEELAMKLKETTLAVYSAAAAYALSRGIILADTKLEFGLDAEGNLVLADEVLTPDSSRYWPADSYEPGKVQPSFDKQYVRNWLTGPKANWSPAGGTEPPELPGAVVEATRDRYIEAYERLSGEKFCTWPGANA
ncbi:phosphoribosylaminoimidazolesuccinocarboxamide synthase [Corynebacterium liangguodongii]|uniref:Phosphoribosylaminoimidazole-succinocarboxamide synthase n=1 Tax=Corynebacterium liangguodongii TaxID=2079535 RepID=A0A2S0WFR6_9CORY|nr:phosphoribosylaminoimidazolesuccinocarboxamide synthase [Corynebacterium liangguodongii]AWB84625.1 phosphoribosylaminoimidazolesuccinocarboxamide synthase [Corynebacterium liangguodongii]PWB99633.1 phosphoribosylaminoimidazolesuccinocarboxamide synthase [Corynebacterium liangguodongii]